MGRLDHLKAKPKPRADVPVGEPKPTPAPPAPKPPPAKYKCGHLIPADIADSNCPPCQSQRRRERNAAKDAKRKRPWRPMRLPPGSRKVIAWDGTEWTGVLTVPGVGEFHVTAPTEHDCCHGLHARYVESSPEHMEILKGDAV